METIGRTLSAAWAAAVSLFMALTGLSTAVSPGFPGYVEAENVFVAAPLSGTLSRLSVARGRQVRAGDVLFVLEQENEIAARNEAEGGVKRAEAQLENLRKGRRPDEIAVIEAQRMQAESALKLSETQFRRQEQLVSRQAVAQGQLDEARAAYDRDRARVVELTAQLRSARLPARDDDIRAAQAALDTARAALAQAEWRLLQKTASAPADGIVVDTLYNEGEWVQAGTPIVSLLPPANIKVRFFVPQTLLGSIHVGQAVRMHCDGCTGDIAGTIAYIAPQAEYTPPVIYSRENRSKLVFLVEARPAPDSPRLHPGQPIDVLPLKP